MKNFYLAMVVVSAIAITATEPNIDSGTDATENYLAIMVASAF